MSEQKGLSPEAFNALLDLQDEQRARREERRAGEAADASGEGPLDECHHPKDWWCSLCEDDAETEPQAGGQAERKAREAPRIELTRESTGDREWWVAKMGIYAAQGRLATDAVYELGRTLSGLHIVGDARVEPVREIVDTIAGRFETPVDMMTDEDVIREWTCGAEIQQNLKITRTGENKIEGVCSCGSRIWTDVFGSLTCRERPRATDHSFAWFLEHNGCEKTEAK